MNEDKVTCAVCGNTIVYMKGLCRKCYTKQYYKKNKDKILLYKKMWFDKNPEKCNIYAATSRRKKGILPMSENRKCSSFLGIHVAERVLSKVFKNVVRQPTNTHGFDFICNKGKKIDVKSSCIRNRNRGKPYWQFNIRKNKIADYFLLIAFDNRENLNPLYTWLIPSYNIRDYTGISLSVDRVCKLDKYVIDIDKVSKCCDIMKGEHK